MKIRKVVSIALTVSVVLLTAACGQKSVSAAPRQTEYGIKVADFCSYTVPDGWVEAGTYSTEDKIFYVQEGHEDDGQPDNVSVNIGRNRYRLADHMKFRDAIVKQLAAQLSGRTDTIVSGEGVYTDQEYIMYVFTIEEKDAVTTKQYYIVDDYRYCLIILTNFDGSQEAARAAEEIADSFVWTAEDEGK